jgi:outer membrane murein-binding lipoprotein Lpp
VSKREAAADADPERVRKLEAALEETETERQSLADERDRLAAERDEIESERDELAEAVDRLESEVEDLREERDRLRDELSNARERLPDAERTLTPGEAREGTNLFIRYDSKEGATLADAHEGAADREALRENLRVEHHTSFETDGLAVDGRPFEEFLQDTIEYGFTRWLVEDLPFEVRGTGNEGTLRDLYDALPEIDRAEIGGTVSIAIREGGEETREQRAFDLVLRDRMGHPLFVADLNDSRDPTAEGTLESLVENGRDIAASNETFAGAFAVTESFFEPGALETASDAVGGGLFSRSKRASFVKLSRKQGYHLCLVEARDGGFHMTVPDL